MDYSAPLEVIFIPQVEYKLPRGQILKVKGNLFNKDIMGALSWFQGDKWTNAWTVTSPTIEYQYVVEFQSRTDVLRKINIAELALDRKNSKGTICVIMVEDCWEFPEKTKILVSQVPISKERGCIVLGKSLNKDGSAPEEVITRMQKLAKIVKEQPQEYKLAILTGSKVNQTVKYEAEAMYEVGVKFGIDPGLMMKEIHAKSTLENAIFSKIIAVGLGIVDWDVITSNYHLRRSEEIFKRVFGSPDIFKFRMIDDDATLSDEMGIYNNINESQYFSELPFILEYSGFLNN